MERTQRSRKEDHAQHPSLTAIGERLKIARETKALSQRALSARTGLPQSHISQIENAGTDLRLTSLLAISHALDLEVALIPRHMVSALESLQRGSSSVSAAQDLAGLTKTVERLISELKTRGIDDADQLSALRQTLKELAFINFSEPQAQAIKDRTHHLRRPLNQLRNMLELKGDIGHAANYRSTLVSVFGTIKPITNELKDLRNRFVHEAGARQIPAYRLEDEDDA